MPASLAYLIIIGNKIFNIK